MPYQTSPLYDREKSFVEYFLPVLKGEHKQARQSWQILLDHMSKITATSCTD